MSSRSSGENEIAAAIWGRDRSNWGGLFWNPFLFRGGFLRYELFSIEGFTRTGLIGGGYLIRGQHYEVNTKLADSVAREIGRPMGIGAVLQVGLMYDTMFPFLGDLVLCRVNHPGERC